MDMFRWLFIENLTNKKVFLKQIKRSLHLFVTSPQNKLIQNNYNVGSLLLHRIITVLTYSTQLEKEKGKSRRQQRNEIEIVRSLNNSKCQNNLNELKGTDLGNKIKALSKLFECSPEEVVHLMDKYQFLLKYMPSTIESRMKVLLDAGISKNELMNDLWIVTYNNSTIEKRLQLLKELNLTPVKPWLLRCMSNFLVRMSKNRESNRLAMGSCKTVSDYLKERLEMTDVQAQIFAAKHPIVMRVNVSKLKEIIDYLFAEGFGPIQITQTPRILCHSLITIQERLNKLKCLNCPIHHLTVLCKSKRSFDNYVESIGTQIKKR